MQKINRSLLKRDFEKCDKAFESCWNTLVQLKNLDQTGSDLASKLISFQVTLATPLYELGQLSNKISAIQKELIVKKKTYNEKWFRRKMKSLADYRSGIQHVINIGKGLGDAFAYFFYRNDSELLEKQFFHERIDSSLPETGAKGELAFLKNIRHLDGQLAIYHGITNILRYGDFSFYDLRKHHVAEIGELKTRRLQGNEHELMLTAISTRTTTEPQATEIKAITTLNQNIQDKLERQIDAIAKILTPETNQLNLNSQTAGTSYIQQLEKLYADSKVNQYNLVQADRGLLLASARLPKACLFTRIFNRRMNRLINGMPDSIIDEVKKLMKQGSLNNSILLGHLLYYDGYVDKNIAGSVPLFWYPLSEQLLKALYFNNVIVLTVYNPAYLIDELKAIGFHANTKYNSHEKGDDNFSIDNFDKLITYVTHHLQTEQTLIELIQQIEDVKAKNPQLGKILFRPHIKMNSLYGLTDHPEAHAEEEKN